MLRIVRDAGRLAGAIIISLQLLACSYTGQSTRLEQAPPPGLPLSRELVQTPFFAQERYQCGPAALATVLVDRGVEVHPDALVDKVYLPKRQGSVTVEMDAAARSFGMLVYPLSSNLEALLQEVAAGNPVLVLQNLGLDWWPRWHYAVVMGYSLEERMVILRSGVTQRYVMSMGVFETTWRRADYWARVVLPAGVVPASAEVLDYVKAAAALEQSGKKNAALSGYRAATEHWPDSPLAWLARGNLAYELGMNDEAETSFRLGLKAEPGNAALWNNLGYALARRQCGSQAREAVRCAIALAPENPGYLESLQDVKTVKRQPEGCEAVVCPVAEAAVQRDSR